MIRSIKDAKLLHTQVLNRAERTATRLCGFAGRPLDLFYSLCFQPVGHDPLTGESLNVIEQINQTFTILLSLRAVESLIEMHPKANGFRLALATSSGCDIESVKPDLVAARVLGTPTQHPEIQEGHGAPGVVPSTAPLYVLCSAEGVSGRQAPLETAPWVEVNCVTLLDGEDSGKKTNVVRTR